MEITYDRAKNERNIRERALPFECVAEFDFETAVIKVDNRRDYGEIRLRALGFLDDRLHALVYTRREGAIRVISFRRAKKKEVTLYEKAKQA